VLECLAVNCKCAFSKYEKKFLCRYEHYILLSEGIFKVKVNVLMFHLTVFVCMLVHVDDGFPEEMFLFSACSESRI
jgi:hypothetical protein